ncbi:hypothetical protein KFU94_04280 [Chloroflexi bacterium TSY]|nr:hypothetical protein [Chloroflexi bacterium TSY]
MANAVTDSQLSPVSTAVNLPKQHTSGLARKEAIEGYLFLLPNFWVF